MQLKVATPSIKICSFAIDHVLNMKTAQLPYNQIIRIFILFFLLVVVGFVPYDILFDESHSICIHYYLFGFQCPLCGMTRAVYQLLHFQFASAISYNVVVALLPLYFLIEILSFFIPKNSLAIARKAVLAFIALALILLYASRIALHFQWI